MKEPSKASREKRKGFGTIAQRWLVTPGRTIVPKNLLTHFSFFFAPKNAYFSLFAKEIKPVKQHLTISCTQVAFLTDKICQRFFKAFYTKYFLSSLLKLFF